MSIPITVPESGLRARPAKAIVQAVDTSATALETGAGTECYGVLVQSAAFNDSNAAVSGVAYVSIDTVLGYELSTGDEVWVPCSNTNQVALKTQSGTAFARCLVYRAPSVG